MRIISCKKLLNENLGRMNSLKNQLMTRASEMGQRTGTQDIYTAVDKIDNPSNYVQQQGNNQGSGNNPAPTKIYEIIANFSTDAKNVSVGGNFNLNGCVGVFGTFFLIVSGDTVTFKDSHGGTLQFNMVTEYTIQPNGAIKSVNNKVLGQGKLFVVSAAKARSFNFDSRNSSRNQNKITPGHTYLYVHKLKDVSTTQTNP